MGRVGFRKVKNKIVTCYYDKHPKFKEHIVKQCKKSWTKTRTLMKAFIQSQFGYCSLIWMFFGRNLNNWINHLQEKSLRIAFNDYESSFQELLELDNSVSIHHRDIRLLANVLFKVKNGVSNQIMYELFDLWNIEYNFDHKHTFHLEQYIRLTMV